MDATPDGDMVLRRRCRAVSTVGVAMLLMAGAAPAVAVAVPFAVPVAVPASAAAVLADSTTDPGEGHDAMPGMDAPAEEKPAQDMPGMDMPLDEMTTEGAEHAGPVSRPRGAVLGTFAGINGAVLIGAAALRRKTQNTPHPRRGARVTPPAAA